MKIYVTKVTKYEFEGYILESAISPKILEEELKIIPETTFDKHVHVEGSFSVECSEDECMVYDPTVYLVNEEHSIAVDERMLDVDHLCDQIQQKGDNDYWLQEAYEHAASRMYDDWKDR